MSVRREAGTAVAARKIGRRNRKKKLLLMTSNFFKFDLEVSAWMSKKKSEHRMKKVFKRDFSWLHFDGLFFSPSSGGSHNPKPKQYLDAGNLNLLLIEGNSLSSSISQRADHRQHSSVVVRQLKASETWFIRIICLVFVAFHFINDDKGNRETGARNDDRRGKILSLTNWLCCVIAPWKIEKFRFS